MEYRKTESGKQPLLWISIWSIRSSFNRPFKHFAELFRLKVYAISRTVIPWTCINISKWRKAFNFQHLLHSAYKNMKVIAIKFSQKILSRSAFSLTISLSVMLKNSLWGRASYISFVYFSSGPDFFLFGFGHFFPSPPFTSTFRRGMHFFHIAFFGRS